MGSVLAVQPFVGVSTMSQSGIYSENKLIWWYARAKTEMQIEGEPLYLYQFDAERSATR